MQYDSTTRREALIMLLATGRSYRSIGRELQMDEAAIRKWAHQLDVVEAVRVELLRRREMIRGALVTASLDALQALQEVAIDEAAAPADRIKAADRILHYAGLDPAIEVHTTTVSATVDLADVQARLDRVRGLGALQVIDVDSDD